MRERERETKPNGQIDFQQDPLIQQNGPLGVSVHTSENSKYIYKSQVPVSYCFLYGSSPIF